jgi:hypothetical protein
VNVLAVNEPRDPLALGAPDFAPTVKRKPVFDGELIVDTPAASRIIVNPANETAFVTGNATSVPFV